MADVTRSTIVSDPEAFWRTQGKPLLREVQLEEIRACFSGDLAKVRPIHAWVHGPPGAGKTLCVRYLLDEAQGKGVLPAYVNCRERFTFLSVVESILDVVKPLRSPKSTKERQLSILMSTLADKRAVIALDEIDVLREKDATDLLHHLSGLPQVSLICIASSRQPLLKLSDAVKSRLAPRQILFPRYLPEETLEILQDVIHRALKEGVCEPEALRKIVDHSYGDARRAIALLRHGVQRVEEEGAPLLKPDHLKVSNIDHFSLRAEDQLNLLSSHHRILYELVCANQPVPSTKLDADYRNTCEARGTPAVSPRTVTKYLDVLTRLKVLHRERGPGTAGWIYSLPKHGENREPYQLYERGGLPGKSCPSRAPL